MSAERTKQTGEVGYARDRRIVLTTRESKSASYEMRFAGWGRPAEEVP